MTMPSPSSPWRLEDKDPLSANCGKSFVIDLRPFPRPMRETLADYVWTNYVTGGLRPVSLYGKVLNLLYFNDFAKSAKVASFDAVTPSTVEDYLSYLRTTVSRRFGKPLAYRSQYTVFKDFKAAVVWLQGYRPEAAPPCEVFTGCEFAGVNAKVGDPKYIPDDVVNEINEALVDEPNPNLRYGIVIMEFAGMRISELEFLTVDCVKKHPISGWTIEWFDFKKGVYRKPVPTSAQCAEAVELLVAATADIREKLPEDKRDRLFVFYDPRHHPNYRPVPRHTMRSWLHDFAERNDIRGRDGEILRLNVHDFRRTLGTDMLSKGVDLDIVREVLGHASVTTARRYYARVKDPERAAAFKSVGVVGSIRNLPDETFESQGDREWFEENAHCRAALSDGYCTKPFESGEMCSRLLSRQKCYTCARYITTPEFLDAHRAHLSAIEAEVAANEACGDHYRDHFTPTIEMLRSIIESLEAIQNEQ